jgi:acyl dehydratase
VTDPAPVSSRRLYWEDFTVGQVREFGRCEVTRDAVIAFALEFDPQPFHLDDAAAEQSLFGRLAASGWHTAAMAMRMMCDGYLLDSASLGSPGIDQLRWKKPVFPGDVLRMRLTVVSARALDSRPGVGVIQSLSEVLNQHDDVVMSMQGSSFFTRRSAVA